MTGGSGGNSGRPGRRGCTVGVRVPGGRRLRSDNSENQTCQYERLNARNENKIGYDSYIRAQDMWFWIMVGLKICDLQGNCKLKICGLGLARFASSDTPTTVFWMEQDHVAT
ncbi:hypothetical protein VPH35_054011 [Triticum aestivum]|uniref:Uncharacterized protein n=1 Tax=Triticum aestivum TaxID=4565 RepID=A0A077S5M7_WHEAT|nr:unnamed protein product [Triticum aestivum]